MGRFNVVLLLSLFPLITVGETRLVTVTNRCPDPVMLELSSIDRQESTALSVGWMRLAPKASLTQATLAGAAWVRAYNATKGISFFACTRNEAILCTCKDDNCMIQINLKGAMGFDRILRDARGNVTTQHGETCESVGGGKFGGFQRVDNVASPVFYIDSCN